jgi:drug/metabolite transporter (DMT)-like permease
VTAASPAARRSGALAMSLAAIVCWAVSPVMVRAVAPFFPVNFQNFIRYLASLLVVWPAYLLTAGRGRLKGDVARLRKAVLPIVLIALVNYAFQIFWTFSLTLISPSLLVLVNQTQVLFGVMFALLFFPDERAFVRSPSFVAGVALALAGVVLVVVGGRSWGTAALGLGVLAVLGGASTWALMGTLIKKMIPDLPPLLSVSGVFSVATPLFLVTFAAMHGGFPVPAATPVSWVLLVASGLIGVGIGHSLYYAAVPVLGVSTTASLGLLGPFIAAVVSYLALGETLTAVQLAGAAVLIGGSYLVIRARFRRAAPVSVRRAAG